MLLGVSLLLVQKRRTGGRPCSASLKKVPKKVLAILEKGNTDGLTDEQLQDLVIKSYEDDKTDITRTQIKCFIAKYRLVTAGVPSDVARRIEADLRAGTPRPALRAALLREQSDQPSDRVDAWLDAHLAAWDAEDGAPGSDDGAEPVEGEEWDDAVYDSETVSAFAARALGSAAAVMTTTTPLMLPRAPVSTVFSLNSAAQLPDADSLTTVDDLATPMVAVGRAPAKQSLPEEGVADVDQSDDVHGLLPPLWIRADPALTLLTF